jgi:hypothetical protein
MFLQAGRWIDEAYVHLYDDGIKFRFYERMGE